MVNPSHAPASTPVSLAAYRLDVEQPSDEIASTALILHPGQSAAEHIGGEPARIDHDTPVVVRTPDGELRDLAWRAAEEVKVELVALGSPDGLAVLRHSTAHVLAQAVQGIYPNAKLGNGPAIEDGFFYDFLVSKPFRPEHLSALQQKMQQIIKSGQFFQRRELSPDPPSEFSVIVSDRSGS